MTASSAQCIQKRMQNVLTVRLPPALRAKLDRKAASLGRATAEHVRQVLEADVASAESKPKRFVCLSLKGRHAIGRGSSNAAIRRALASRANEKDR